MAVCFDFRSTNVVQLSNWNLYFYRLRCHHPLITQLIKRVISHVAYLLEQIGVTVKQINPQEIVKLAWKLIMITMLIIMTIGMDSCLNIVNTVGNVSK